MDNKEIISVASGFLEEGSLDRIITSSIRAGITRGSISAGRDFGNLAGKTAQKATSECASIFRKIEKLENQVYNGVLSDVLVKTAKENKILNSDLIIAPFGRPKGKPNLVKLKIMISKKEKYRDCLIKYMSPVYHPKKSGLKVTDMFQDYLFKKAQSQAMDILTGRKPKTPKQDESATATERMGGFPSGVKSLGLCKKVTAELVKLDKLQYSNTLAYYIQTLGAVQFLNPDKLSVLKDKYGRGFSLPTYNWDKFMRNFEGGEYENITDCVHEYVISKGYTPTQYDYDDVFEEYIENKAQSQALLILRTIGNIQLEGLNMNNDIRDLIEEMVEESILSEKLAGREKQRKQRDSKDGSNFKSTAKGIARDALTDAVSDAVKEVFVASGRELASHVSSKMMERERKQELRNMKDPLYHYKKREKKTKHDAKEKKYIEKQARKLAKIQARKLAQESVDMYGVADEKNVTLWDVNNYELQLGIDVESEHTRSEPVAMEIALNHLAEIPDYYTRLQKMEDEAKAELDEEGFLRDVGREAQAPAI